MEQLGREKIVSELYNAAYLEVGRQKENDTKWKNRRHTLAYIAKELGVSRQRIHTVFWSLVNELPDDSDDRTLLSVLVPEQRQRTEYEVLLKKALDEQKVRSHPDTALILDLLDNQKPEGRNMTPLERQWRKKLKSLIK